VTPKLRLAALAVCALAVAGAPAPAEARAPFALTRDLSYDLGGAPAPATSQLVDVYRPPGLRRTARRPVVVWIHGGGWRRGDKRLGSRRKAELFTRAGYVFASINYRLSPPAFDPERPDPSRVRFPDHPADVGEALAWLRRHADEHRGDGRRIVAIGHSAGAHLAALVASDPSYVREFGRGARPLGFVALDSPAFDITAAAAPGSDRPRGSREMLWNAFGTPTEAETTGAWTLGSPLHHADPGDPPGLIVTQRGEPGRVAEAERMAAAIGPPRASVLAVDLDHREINQALGRRPDPSGVTRAVIDAVGRWVGRAPGQASDLRR
jgi:acetyl esterase/lipase